VNEDEEGRLKSILGVVLAAEKTPTNAPHHRGMPSHESGKGIVVFPLYEAFQEFGVRDAISIAVKGITKLVNEQAQLAGRHRLEPR